MTEQKAKQTPAGGVLVGKREGQTIIHDKGTQGGYFVGKLHKEGGIKGINKSTGQPIEVQGGEVIITAPAVADQSKREFEGEMLTNREILSKINEKGGGVSLENGGEIYYTGTSYNYGGKTMTDYEIMQSMNDCGCEDEYEDGGTIITYKNKYNKKYGYSANESHNLEEIAKDTGISLKGLQQIYNKGIGAYKTNPESVRPNVKSKEQWAMARVYSAVMGGKASKIDANELKMNYGGQLNLMNESKKGDHTSRDLNNYNDLMDVGVDGQVGAESGLFADGGGVGERLTKKVIQFNALNNGWYLETIGGYGNPIAVLYDKNGKEIKFSTKWEIKDKWSTYFEEIGIIGVLKDPNYPKSYHLIYKKDTPFAKGGLIAPNGKTSNLTPEQYKLVRTPEFKEWFGDWENDPENASKVVDENGEPLVVYHGTYVENPFYIFDFDKADLGFHFGTYEQAKNRSETKLFFKGRKSIVNSFFLNIKTIFESTDIGEWEYPQRYIDMFVSDGLISESDAKKNGFYRLVQREENKQIREYLLNKYGKFGGFVYNNKYEGKGNSFIVLNPKQIKLADGSNTTFDNMNPDIRYATGGDVKPYDANMDGDSADTMYKEGGATLSAEVFEWDKVPTNYRNISKVKKVPFTNNPMDKGLDSIVTPFLGEDNFNPKFMGLNFDENGITATDTFILITLPYPNDKYNGIYDIARAKKQKSKDLLLINEKYPNYEAIIPKSNVIAPYEVDVYKLLQYTKTAINYANKTTKKVSFKFGDNERIGFDGTLLSDVLTTCLKLGYEKIYAFITASNRPIVLSPNKDYELGNDDILLLMPVILFDKYYGSQDIDFSRSLKAYYDFNDNEIHNADGSVAEFKMQYESNQLVDDNYLALLSKMIKKNRFIIILEYVKVENGKMTATDLEISLIVKDVNMPNGIYEIVNNAPNITMNPIEDFPQERVFNKGEYETHWKENRETAFEFVTFSEVFEFYLDKLLLSVGKDDLRPVMSGICIKKTAQNEMFLVTTDAHTLCKINITEYCEFNKDSRELEYILPVKYLKDFVKLADGSLHFKCSMANIFIEADNLDFIGRTIDGKYPNYDAVIPRDSTKKIVFDHVAMNKCLKSPEMTNLIAKYKGRKDILFDFFNIGNTLNIKVSENKGYNVQDELIESIELCKIDFNYQEVESTLSLDQSAFLLMPSKDEFKENQYFSFRKEFFDVMLETITDTEVDCYFSEPNRPYVFPIDAIDYKKTLKVEKTKQQKLSKKDLEQIVELEELKDTLEPIAYEKPNIDQKLSDLISILKSKYSTGESLKSLYDQVKEAYGSANVGAIFSTFASEMKNNKKFMEEFNKTSFIDNVVIKSESNELQEAIETLEMLIGTAKGKDKKDIKEALEILKMLQ